MVGTEVGDGARAGVGGAWFGNGEGVCCGARVGCTAGRDDEAEGEASPVNG